MRAILNSRRLLNAAGFLVCASLIAYALYAEYVLLYIPCPLCVLQRLSVIALGVVFLVAALHGASGAFRWVYAVLIAAAAAFGIGVASRHLWLQSLPPEDVPASCGMGFDHIIRDLPLGEALRTIFTGSGECAKVDWTMFGLSMPAWVLIAIVPLGLFGFWANARRAG